MRKAALSSVFFVLMVYSGLIARNVEAGEPKIVCNEPEYNFGELENTRDAECVFVLRNDGDAVLDIAGVHTGCGCTAAKAADRRVAPGKKTELSVVFSLRGRKGPQKQQITVISNDPIRPRLNLFIIGEAIPVLSVRPERVFWGKIHKNSVLEKVIELNFRFEKPVNILALEIASSMFEVEKAVVKEGWDYEIRVKTVPPMAPGAFDQPLRIKTDHTKTGEIIVPMSGRVVDEIFSVPGEIVISPDEAEPAMRFLILRSVEDKPFSVLRVEPSISGIESEIRATGPARTMIYLKNISARPELDGAAIRIVIDNEAVPELTVPVRIGRFSDDLERVK